MNHTWRRLLLISWGAAATLAGCTATLEGGAEGGEEYEAESHKGTCAKLKRRCEYGQATACEVWTRLCAPASKSDASKHPDASRADYDGIAKDGGTDATPDAAPSPPPSTNVLYVDGTLTSNCQSNYSVAARKCSVPMGQPTPPCRRE